MLPPDVRIPEEAVQGLFMHDVQEFANWPPSCPSSSGDGGQGRVEARALVVAPMGARP